MLTWDLLFCILKFKFSIPLPFRSDIMRGNRQITPDDAWIPYYGIRESVFTAFGNSTDGAGQTASLQSFILYSLILFINVVILLLLGNVPVAVLF